MSALAEKKGQEADAWEEITNEGVRQQEFFWGYADAYFMPSGHRLTFVGEWVSPHENDREFVAKTNQNGSRYALHALFTDGRPRAAPLEMTDLAAQYGPEDGRMGPKES